MHLIHFEILHEWGVVCFIQLKWMMKRNKEKNNNNNNRSPATSIRIKQKSIRISWHRSAANQLIFVKCVGIVRGWGVKMPRISKVTYNYFSSTYFLIGFAYVFHLNGAIFFHWKKRLFFFLRKSALNHWLSSVKKR